MDYLTTEHRLQAQRLLDDIRGALRVKETQLKESDDEAFMEPRIQTALDQSLPIPTHHSKVTNPWEALGPLNLFEKAKEQKEVNLYAAKHLFQEVLRTPSVDLECQLQCQQQLISIALLQDPLSSVLQMIKDFQLSLKTCQQRHVCSHPTLLPRASLSTLSMTSVPTVAERWQYEGALLLGHVYRVKGRSQQALEKYREAELICKSSTLQESNLEIDAIIYQQLCLSAVGKYTEALKTLESLSKHSFTGSTQTTFLYTLGCVYRCTGSFQKAEEALTASVKIATDLNCKEDIFQCKAELGRVYRATGDFSKALELQESLYDYAVSRGDIMGIATACSLMGFTLQYHKDSSGYPNFAKAVQFLAVGMQLSHELGNTENIGWCLNNIAKAYIKSKKYKEALELCKRRLQIAKETQNIVGEGTAYGNAGLACRGLGRFHDAVHYHKSYLDIVQKPMDKAWMEHEIALDYLAMGELSSALQFALKELITNNEIQLQYTKPADKEKIANFDKNHARCFNLLQYVLVQQERFQEALVVADMGRAQAVADIVVQKGDNHTNSPPTATEVVLPSGHLNPTQISRSLKGFEEVVYKLQTSLVLYSVIDSPLPEHGQTTWLYTWVVNPNSPSIYFTQQILMPADQMGFDLLLGKEQQYFSELKMNAVDHRDILLVKAKESQNHGNRSPQPSLVEQVNTKLAHFHDILISPIESFLSDQTSRIIFVPHRFLLTVPYPALYGTKGRLVERFTISVALSSYLLQLSILRLMNSDSLIKEEHFLAVGNPLMPREDFPQLKGASEEAHAVVKAFSAERSTLLCEAEATKETVCKYLPLSKIAHFATHAFQQELHGHFSDNSRDTSYSDYTMKGGMVLAKSSKECSGILTSLEVQELHIPAELVVLSCCKTAQGRITHDGTLGLSRAFICAGASAVIVTLWSIDDESTVTLMRKFYQHYSVSHDAATSLQNAMQSLHAEGRGPGYWGAFCLLGITPGQLKISHSHLC